MALIPVLLSGGVGSRLWPLSRRSLPKQLQRLTGDVTMVQATALRLRGLAGVADPVVVSGAAHASAIDAQLAEVDCTPARVIAEPIGRNTAPAVALAALTAEPDDVLVVLPSDHVIVDVPAFQAAVTTAVEAADEGNLVLFGVVPTHPATGYGYVRSAGPGVLEPVEEFVEKPDLATAERYVASGSFRWNSGMFVLPVGLFLDELHRHRPDVLEAVKGSLADARRDGRRIDPDASFGQSPSISIDHAVMEQTDRAVVVALDAGWTDVGTWDALWELEDRDASGNVIAGDVVVADVERSLIRSSARTVAVVGLSDVVVVETADAVLVARMSRAEEVKAVVDRLVADGRDDLT